MTREQEYIIAKLQKIEKLIATDTLSECNITIESTKKDKGMYFTDFHIIYKTPTP